MNEIIPIRKQNFLVCLKNTVNARELHAFLQNKDHFSTWIKEGWIFRQGGAWVGKSDKVERGYITHSYHNITHKDGWIETKTQVLVTPKGLAKLAEIFGVQS